MCVLGYDPLTHTHQTTHTPYVRGALYTRKGVLEHLLYTCVVMDRYIPLKNVLFVPTQRNKRLKWAFFDMLLQGSDV
jgi:hypothetical protein